MVWNYSLATATRKKSKQRQWRNRLTHARYSRVIQIPLQKGLHSTPTVHIPTESGKCVYVPFITPWLCEYHFERLIVAIVVVVIVCGMHRFIIIFSLLLLLFIIILQFAALPCWCSWFLFDNSLGVAFYVCVCVSSKKNDNTCIKRSKFKVCTAKSVIHNQNNNNNKTHTDDIHVHYWTGRERLQKCDIETCSLALLAQTAAV